MPSPGRCGGRVAWRADWRKLHETHPEGGEVNAKATNFEEEAWALVFGVEARWLEYDRSGFLHWVRTGRERYAAAADGRSVYLHAEGQGAFAF